MPELPEVETLVQQLTKDLTGIRILKCRVIHQDILESRREALEQKTASKKILAVRRFAKYIRMELEDELSLWFHLGMTGQLLWKEEVPADPHIHIALMLKGTSRVLCFRDIRKFGKVFYTEPGTLPASVRELGPDPLQISPEEFAKLLQGRSGRIKNLLLNQKIVSGLGNIYASESLYRAGIHPARRSSRLSVKAIKRLHAAVCEVLLQAIRFGGSSVDDYRHINGQSGKFQNYHQVYARTGEPCRGCTSSIRKIELAGRSSFYCPRCQK